MKIKDLLDGYYAGTLTDSEEERLEMLMLSGAPEIPEKDRRLYLGIANIPVTAKPVRHRHPLALKISSIAASFALIVGLGYYSYLEQQKQIMTQQEILELAMGNVSIALHKTDTSRQQLAYFINSINADTTKQEEEEIHNPEEI